MVYPIHYSGEKTGFETVYILLAIFLAAISIVLLVSLFCNKDKETNIAAADSNEPIAMMDENGKNID